LDRRIRRAALTISTSPVVAVLLEDGRSTIGAELIGAARQIADELGGRVAGIAAYADQVDIGGADEWHIVQGVDAAEDMATGLIDWCRRRRPWTLLAPSTAFGREVAGRTAASLGAGLVGDAIELRLADGDLVAAKPAFSGALVADITCASPIRIVTIRPGVLPARGFISGANGAEITTAQVQARGRVRVISSKRDDEIESLARAEVVIGVGAGVLPDDYHRLSPLASVLGAELAATRKVTDKGWAPRSRQIGITGRSVDPRLYVAIGLSGKFNHVVGVRGAGTILAINVDPSAPIFGHADIGIVGDWQEVVPLLQDAIRAADQ
jgi:electron transfer flavoprotein alpha subunit